MRDWLAIIAGLLVLLLTFIGCFVLFEHNKHNCEKSGGEYVRKPYSKSMECIHH